MIAMCHGIWTVVNVDLTVSMDLMLGCLATSLGSLTFACLSLSGQVADFTFNSPAIKYELTQVYNWKCQVETICADDKTAVSPLFLIQKTCFWAHLTRIVRGHNFRPPILEYSQITSPNIFHHCKTPYIPPTPTMTP